MLIVAAGSLLSYFMEPVYVSSITIGLSHVSTEIPVMEDNLRRALQERILPLADKLIDPFQVNKVCIQHLISLFSYIWYFSYELNLVVIGSLYFALLECPQGSFSILRQLWAL